MVELETMMGGGTVVAAAAHETVSHAAVAQESVRALRFAAVFGMVSREAEGRCRFVDFHPLHDGAAKRMGRRAAAHIGFKRCDGPSPDLKTVDQFAGLGNRGTFLRG